IRCLRLEEAPGCPDVEATRGCGSVVKSWFEVFSTEALDIRLEVVGSGCCHQPRSIQCLLGFEN
ncbi:MAG: hypothetical protein QF437_08745, partial [Planctomycetota bacterium]|nr:hypothetical protein [Planctomycetota bacterium]